jgi:hypothetical protein
MYSMVFNIALPPKEVHQASEDRAQWRDWLGLTLSSLDVANQLVVLRLPDQVLKPLAAGLPIEHVV